MIKLYQFALSGNCHKVRMLLSFLNLPHEVVNVSGAKAEHKSAEFLALNPFGQVPLLVDGDAVIRDSQAILFYLAQKYGSLMGQAHWLPTDPASTAEVVSWLSVAANEISRGPGMLRMHHKFGRAIDVVATEKITSDALTVLDAHLGNRTWLVGTEITIADLAVYAYVALAPEGRVDLSRYPHVLKWLQQVQSRPAYVGMDGMFSALDQ